MPKYINVDKLRFPNIAVYDMMLDGEAVPVVRLDELRKLPSEDVAPVKRGQWISDAPGKRFGKPVRLDKDGCPVDSCHCSECGEWLTASDEYPARGRYCPNCGAIMNGGENG